jgi:membrane protein required for colicin V production
VNKLDVLVVGIFGLATAFGLWKGMVRQIVTLAGIIGGYIISSKLYGTVAGMLPKGMEPGLAKVLGFLLVFIVCVIASLVLGQLAGRFLKVAGLGWANRLGGGVLGFLKGFLIAAPVVAGLVAFLPSDSALLNTSVTVPYVISGIRIMGNLMPHDIREKYQHGADTMRKRLTDRGLEKGKDLRGPSQ